jgi:hypothetical protein
LVNGVPTSIRISRGVFRPCAASCSIRSSFPAVPPSCSRAANALTELSLDGAPDCSDAGRYSSSTVAATGVGSGVSEVQPIEGRSARAPEPTASRSPLHRVGPAKQSAIVFWDRSWHAAPEGLRKPHARARSAMSGT